MSNTFGTLFRLTDFGESHGAAVGGIIDGCPAGLEVDVDFVQSELDRRRPSEDAFSTKRSEPDKVRFLSGIYQGKTLGTPIGFLIENQDVRTFSNDVIKPSHASLVYKHKYGHVDNFGSGRASARQTVARVVAGAIAKLYLKQFGITIAAELLQLADIQQLGDTAGALIGGVIRHLPVGLGEPIYNKFDAQLAFAMMSINAAKSFELGRGREAATMCGSAYNDLQNADYQFLTNNDGGVQAGITNGEEVNFKVAFKPIPSIQMAQKTFDFSGKQTEYIANDRNDTSVYPRVLVVVEAMAALVVADFLLLKNSKNSSYGIS